jgi:tetratricopeptide (TPR) repeat protein
MTDTEAARNDLRIARQYIDKNHDKNEPKHNYFSNLDYAMKYVNRAREKDPNVTLKLKLDDSKKIIDWTPDRLEAEVFAIKGVYYSNFDDSQDDLSTAVNLLEHSIKLFPTPTAYAALARSYNNMARRDDALVLLQDGARRWPADMKIQPLIDHMEADPTLGKSIYRTPNQIANEIANKKDARKIFIIRAVPFAFFAYSFVNILTLSHPATGMDIFTGLLGFIGFIMFISTLFISNFPPTRVLHAERDTARRLIQSSCKMTSLQTIEVRSKKHFSGFALMIVCSMLSHHS